MKAQKVQVRVLVGFVNAREHFRSYVPGDVVDLPKDRAEALAVMGAVEIVQHPAARRETKVTKPAEAKAPVGD